MHPDCAKPAAYYNLRDWYRIERPILCGVYGAGRAVGYHAHVIDHKRDRVTCLGSYPTNGEASAVAQRHGQQIGLADGR